MMLKKNKDFKFTSEHLVHIFARLVEFVLILSEKGYCHSNLKPENVALVHVQKDCYVAKFIDFSQLTQNEFKPRGYTANYFLNPMRDYDD